MTEKTREFQESMYFCFIDYAKAFDHMDDNKLWKILKEMGEPDHLTCLLKNLYAGQEAIVKTGYEQQTGSKLGKEYVKAVHCHPVYLTYIRSTSCETSGWMKLQLKSRLLREINNLRYADDTTLMAENEDEPNSLLMRVKEDSEKAGLKLNIQKPMIMAPSPVTSWQIDKEKGEAVTDFIFLGSKITADGDCSLKLKRLLLGRKAPTNLNRVLKN